MSTPASPAETQPPTPAEGATATPGAGPQPAGTTQNPPTPEPAPEPTPDPAKPEPAGEPRGKKPVFEGEFDPAKFQTLVENIRGDVAAEKAKREAAEKKVTEIEQGQADFMKKMAALFGVETDESKPPTPEVLAKQLAEAQNQTKTSDDLARQTQVELAVYKTAGRHGGDPDALLDSRGFANAIAKLDPAADGFAADVEKAVKAAVEANPKLAAKVPEQPKTPAPKGGAPMDGAPGTKRQLGKADLERMTEDQIADAVKEGRFTALLRGGS